MCRGLMGCVFLYWEVGAHGRYPHRTRVLGDAVCGSAVWVDGEPRDIHRLWATEGTMAAGHPNLHFINGGPFGMFFVFVQSGTILNVRFKHSQALGCYFNIKLCLPEDMANERLVGLMGTSNSNMLDDWMTRDGTDIKHEGSIYWADAFNYW